MVKIYKKQGFFKNRYFFLCLTALTIVFFILSIILVDSISSKNKWVIEDNKVFIEDNNIYISAEPHTISGGGWVIYNFTSKVYSGDVDIVFGFDTDELRPEKIEVFNQIQKVRVVSYSCDKPNNYFNYTLSPKYFWCYYNKTIYDGLNNSIGSELNLIFEHSFILGDIPTKTASWSETYIDDWQDFSETFTSIDYDYEGMNKWWFNKNININQGQEYIFRVKIKDIDSRFGKPKSKYWFAIKPSSETIQQSIINEHLYALDPWVTGLNEGLKHYYTFNESTGTTALDSVESVNLTGLNTNQWRGGKINGSYTPSEEFIDSSYNLSGVSNNGDFSMSFWINRTGIDMGASDCIGNADADGLSVNGEMEIQCTGANINFAMYDIAAKGTGAVSPSLNQWIFVTAVFNGTSGELFLSGQSRGIIDVPTFNTASETTNLYFFGRSDNTAKIDANTALLDEFAIWNRSLTLTEIINLNTSITFSPLDNTPPAVALNIPLNNSIQSSRRVVFNGSATDIAGSGVANITLFIDDIENITQSGSFFQTAVVLEKGNHNYTLRARDLDNNLGLNETRNFSIDSSNPNLTINTPIGAHSTTTININITVKDNLNMTCFYNISRGASLDVGNSEITDCSNTTAVVSSYSSTYQINVHVNDTANNQNNSNQSFSVSASGGSGGGGGGGGSSGGTIIQKIINLLSPSISADSLCIPLEESFNKSFNQFLDSEDKFSSISKFLGDFWNAIICRSASSIVSFDNVKIQDV